MLKFSIFLCCGINVLLGNSVLSENKSIELTSAEIESELEKSLQPKTLDGYTYEKPTIPFQYPLDGNESFASNLMLTPPLSEVEHQDLGSLHKASRRKGVVKRIKLHNSKSNHMRQKCDGQNDANIADYFEERRRKRPLNRRLAPYNEVFRDEKYFE